VKRLTVFLAAFAATVAVSASSASADACACGNGRYLTMWSYYSGAAGGNGSDARYRCWYSDGYYTEVSWTYGGCPS
jgi:hypothetical protein